MDREIAPEVRRRKVMRRVVFALIALAVAGVALAAGVEWLRPSLRRSELQTAVVTTGDVEAVLEASGIVMPQFEQAVSTPVDARVLRVHRRAGEPVREGDELLTLDTAAASLELNRMDETLQKREKEADRLRLQLEETLASLRAELEAKNLDAEILRLKAQRSAKLRGEGLLSEHDALLDAAAAKKIEMELLQTEQKIQRAERSRVAQLASDALDSNILRRQRDEARRQLQLAMMRAPRGGVVTSIVQEEGATVRAGDVVARVADLSAFRVVASISDLYVPRLVTGMPVRVRIDEKSVVNGTLASIDPRIENGVAQLHVALEPDAHARLRNNLRVDVLFVTSRRASVPQLTRGSLGRSSAEQVFVVRGDTLVRTAVRWGAIGDSNVEVSRGLTLGDEVVISNMTDYVGLEEIRLR